MLALKSRARRAKKAPPEVDPRQLSLPEAPAVGIYEQGDRAALVAKQAWVFPLRRTPTTKRMTVEAALRAGVAVDPVPLSKTQDLVGAAPAAAGLNVEQGLQTPDLMEFFVSQKGGSLAGVLQLRKGKEGAWSAKLSADALPAVLSDEAMPPDGVSALPSTLSDIIPEHLQFWKYRGFQAKRVRDALVSSNIFDPDLVKVVDGEMRLCVQRLFLYQPDAAANPGAPPLEKANLAELLVKSAPTARAVYNPFIEAPNAWQTAAQKALSEDGALVVLSCPEASALEEVVDLVMSPTTKAAWMLEFDASDEALTELGRAGKVFKLDGVDGADGRVFVSSLTFPPQFVIWAAKKAPTPATKRAPADVRPLKRLLVAKADPAPEEERFVLGVVLEPEPGDGAGDAQNDTYSADDVRKAAHVYMEKHQNVGLMHKGFVNDRAKIVENYIAPADFEMAGETVKAGSWLMGVHVLDDELWAAVKKGELGGFSIGGDAIRTPEASA